MKGMNAGIHRHENRRRRGDARRTLGFGGMNVDLVVTSTVMCYPLDRVGESIDQRRVEDADEVCARIVTVDSNCTSVVGR